MRARKLAVTVVCAAAVQLAAGSTADGESRSAPRRAEGRVVRSRQIVPVAMVTVREGAFGCWDLDRAPESRRSQ